MIDDPRDAATPPDPTLNDTSSNDAASNDADLEAVRRSLAQHLAGIRTWGIDRIFGEPRVPVAAASAPSVTSPPSREDQPARPTASSRDLDRAAGDAPTPVDSPARVEPATDPAATLATIASEVAGCRACRLCEERTNTVPGVGDPRAPLMFVGEAPGRDEDLRGEPFVGKAGQLLDKIIAALGFRREEVFIANTLKCRPPNNRDPLPDESAACTPYLERQVRAIGPRMLVALGRPAAQFLTREDRPLGRLRGGKHVYLGIPVVVTYHPAYLLRNPSSKAECWHDLQAVVQTFKRAPLTD